MPNVKSCRRTVKSKPCGFGEKKSVRSPGSANFIAQSISSAASGFIPSGRTDFTKKSTQTGALTIGSDSIPQTEANEIFG